MSKDICFTDIDFKYNKNMSHVTYEIFDYRNCENLKMSSYTEVEWIVGKLLGGILQLV